jgi:RecJ-like exonuclease
MSDDGMKRCPRCEGTGKERAEGPMCPLCKGNGRIPHFFLDQDQALPDRRKTIGKRRAKAVGGSGWGSGVNEGGT